ncbi:hypothetical protein L208DRAFT_1382631 [Tricholoma matsutake]|nr:hypothetical protein L208DRAFT_1382631 [Tricholoma matsutake 945]
MYVLFLEIILKKSLVQAAAVGRGRVVAVIRIMILSFRHPNIGPMIGRSPDGEETPYIIYCGGNHLPKLRLLKTQLPTAEPIHRLHPLIARALRTDLLRSIHLAMMTAGIDYLNHQGFPLQTSLSPSQQILDILVGDNDEPFIVVNPAAATIDHSVTSHNGDHGWAVFSSLCQETFKEVNTILYGCGKLVLSGKGNKHKTRGCWTCRIRRKICDEQPNTAGRCETCVRLHLECLGFGQKLDWLKGRSQVIELHDKIKTFFAQGLMAFGPHSGGMLQLTPDSDNDNALWPSGSLTWWPPVRNCAGF